MKWKESQLEDFLIANPIELGKLIQPEIPEKLTKALLGKYSGTSNVSMIFSGTTRQTPG